MDPTPDSIPSSSSPLAPLQPLLNPKYRHISRSAAKRESVQLLGSIKGLQLHFARAGLVEHRAGSGAGVRGLGSLGEDEENQPPTEAEHRRTKMRKPWKEVDLQRVDVNAARREARGLVGIVRGIWGLDLPLSPSVSTLAIFPGSPAKAAERDTRTTLTTTAQAIRRIRSLALAVSHTSHPRMGERRTSTPSLHPPRPSSGRASISTPSRPGVLPRAVTYAAGQRKSSLGPLEEVDAGADFLGDLRKGALEVLAGLRGLEEHLRVDLEHPPPRAHPSLSSSSPFESSFTAPTSLRPGSSCSVSEQEEYSDDEENYSLNALAQSSAEIESVETWEERIVSEGREYHALNEEGEKERSVVKSVEKWIAAVEKTFAVGYVQESEVEQWAKEIWDGEVIERLHAFLLAHLSITFQRILTSPLNGGTTAFLSRLSDGYILIQAYNAVVSSSSMAWGFVPQEEIHDTLSAVPSTPNGEEGRKTDKEYTFRRVGNLTCWAASLRLRYNLPIQMPSNAASSLFLPVSNALPHSSSPSTTAATPRTSPDPDTKAFPPNSKRGRENAPRIDFDPLIVAKRAEGWEGMLVEVLGKWVEAAAREARGESPVGPKSF